MAEYLWRKTMLADPTGSWGTTHENNNSALHLLKSRVTFPWIHFFLSKIPTIYFLILRIYIMNQSDRELVPPVPSKLWEDRVVHHSWLVAVPTPPEYMTTTSTGATTQATTPRCRSTSKRTATSPSLSAVCSSKVRELPVEYRMLKQVVCCYENRSVSFFVRSYVFWVIYGFTMDNFHFSFFLNLVLLSFFLFSFIVSLLPCIPVSL